MFKIEFATDNAAFEGCAPEVARILRAVADLVEDGATSGLARDFNGNAVGSWELTEEVDTTLDPDDIPEDFEVRPLRPGDVAQDKATCGTCGLSWDDAVSTSMTPAPSARCPFENFHIEGGN